MCLYPKFIKNPKYRPNKKNGYCPPSYNDERVLFVPIGCGKCMECRSQKANQWRIRLLEEVRNNENGKFVTFTFDDKSLRKLEYMLDDNPKGYDLDNAIAKKGVKLWRERWRKRHGRSPRYWLVSELGQENTERLHLHGIIFDKVGKSEIIDCWQYGHVWIGDYVNDSTVNYSIKYFSKQDEKHKYYKPVILCSNGIGKGYLNRIDSKRNQYKEEGTKSDYVTRQGIKMNLPIYYRNHIYSDEEREKLWLELLDKEVRYVDRKKIDVSENYDTYFQIREEKRIENERLGYGSPEIDEQRKQYEEDLRELKRKERW